MVVRGAAGRLQSFPLGSAVLKPNLDLNLGQSQLKRDLRSLGQRQVFLAVKLALQFC